MLNISLQSAILIELCTAFLWGSWFQLLKRIGKYPLPAFMIWLYVFSNIIVWGVMLIFKGTFVPEGIIYWISAKPKLVAICLLGGAMFGIGMQVSTAIMSKLGMVLSVSVSATLGVFTGTVIPMLVNGLPDGMTILTIIIISVLFLSGTLLVQYAGNEYRKDQKDNYDRDIPKVSLKLYLWFLVNTVLGLGYTFGMTYGMRSITNPHGLPPMLCCGLICFGAFLGTIIVSIVRLKKANQLDILVHTSPKVLLFSFLSACGHFGGNVTHMIAAPLLSLAVAWPITTTSNLWTYFWGFVYGEFRNSSKKVVFMLIAGLAMYIAGLIYLYKSVVSV